MPNKVENISYSSHFKDCLCGNLTVAELVELGFFDNKFMRNYCIVKAHHELIMSDKELSSTAASSRVAIDFNLSMQQVERICKDYRFLIKTVEKCKSDRAKNEKPKVRSGNFIT